MWRWRSRPGFSANSTAFPSWRSAWRRKAARVAAAFPVAAAWRAGYHGRMNSAKKLDLVSAEDYLAGELGSPIKHEYLGGVVYAMAGARNAHAIIVMRTGAALVSRLRGKRCQPFGSDTKIRIRLPNQLRFYYPDVSVVCY